MQQPQNASNLQAGMSILQGQSPAGTQQQNLQPCMQTHQHQSPVHPSAPNQAMNPSAGAQVHVAQLPATNSNWRTWQTDADYEQRKQLITHIFQLFTGRQRANTLRPEFKDKLPDFVRRLEEALYRTAHSKEEYSDINTLESRLQNVARRMIRPGSIQGSQILQGHFQMQHPQQQPQPQTVQMQQRSEMSKETKHNNSSSNQFISHHQPSGPQIANSSLSANLPNINEKTASSTANPTSSAIPHASLQVSQHVNVSRNTGMVSGYDSSKLLVNNGFAIQNSLSEPKQPALHGGGVPESLIRGTASREGWNSGPNMLQTGVSQILNSAGAVIVQNSAEFNPDQGMPGTLPSSGVHTPALPLASGVANLTPGIQCGLQGQGVITSPQSGVNSSPGLISQSGNRQPTRKEVEALRKQQKWLLFLRHCIKCGSPQGQCPTWGAKCQHGKNLIRHIEACNSQDCGIPQCLASKKLLKHHQRCQNPKCLVCGPVNSHVEKQRQVQMLHQQQEQAKRATPDATHVAPSNSLPDSHHKSQSKLLEAQSSLPSLQPALPLQQHQQLVHQQQNLQMQHNQLLRQQQQQLQAALRGQAIKNEGLLQTPLMMPTPGGPQIDGAATSSSALIPTPGLVVHGSQGSHAAASQIGNQSNHALHGQAVQIASQTNTSTALHSGAGVAQPNPPSMMPTPQFENSSMSGKPVMKGTSTHRSSGSSLLNPLLETNTDTRLNTNKRVKVEGQFSNGTPGPEMREMIGSVSEVAGKHAIANHEKPLMKSNSPQSTSLVETFSKDLIVTYLAKLKKEAHLENQKSKRKDDKHPLPLSDEVPCSACENSRKSFFEPPVLYCSRCDKRIKENLVYYHGQLKSNDPVLPTGNLCKDYYWCHACFSEVSREKGETIRVEDEDMPKNSILKKKNDDIQEEGWVQCDSCDSWVHQICGLFNRLLNDDNSTHYQCPQCLLKGLEDGTRTPISTRPSSMLEAKDLPRTKLSDFLEEHVKKSIEAEHADRAKMQGKSPEEVPAIEGITIRVVNNVIKKCETKPLFYSTFKDKNYPQFFNYRQKVILLFQKLDGIDICLYCMYTQEYGDDNPLPNRRVSYLSYLDSIKYFQPEGVTAAKRNVALRTFVYHELLVGYLAYLKKRGFHQMFIWACPPTQGDDYILYAHPKTQKNPQLSKLREWYFKMLRHAHEVGIVSRVSNLYDTYFEGGKDHRIDKCSATDMPYFEGDYWPGVAEVHLKAISDEHQKALYGSKLSTKKGSSSRSKVSKGKVLSANNGSKDELLMAKLGENISGGNCNKEDLMVVHLQHVCSICRICINGANRYFSEVAPPVKFEGIKLENGSAGLGGLELCEACYIAECSKVMQQGGQGSTRNRALPGGFNAHDLKQEFIATLPVTIEEWDADMENEIFNTRQQFLSLCQGNHYQFDTTRRTRHSSMMVLYHLHNPTAPAFAGTCNVCNIEIEPGDGFRCTVCDDFDMCRNCHARGVFHEHPMAHQSVKISKADAAALARRRKVVQQQVQQTLELVKHSSTCTVDRCSWHKCDTIKKVIAHMKDVANWRQPHDCKHCRQMGKILKYHASLCKDSECKVYMCKELKDAMRRIAQRQAAQEQHRAQAYQKMLAQQRQGS